MGIIVQKFGGTSVATAEKIHNAARRVIATQAAGHQVVVVVSAMGHTTDELIDLAKQVSDNPPKREMDQLLATGEQVTIALLAMAIHAQGRDAISFTGGQIGLLTDTVHTKARIREIDKTRILSELATGKIVIVAGFQGVTEQGDITTLGRGGSNASLVALGAVLKAEVCENYTDVDGVFTADPRLVPKARKIDRISYDEMMELSSFGAGVLQTRAVEFAKKYNVPIHVRNSGHDRPGTWIVEETKAMEEIAVSGCALKKDLMRVALKNIPDRPGIVAKIFTTIAQANIIIDDIIQNVLDDGTANISFTVEHGDIADLKPVMERLLAELGGAAGYEKDMAKVSVVGVGMKQATGVAATMFKALADQKINIQNISTSEIRISCLVSRADADHALRAVHSAFALDSERP
ncbi:MAG: aspartate kinase [Planctomycetes bacterium]|jgi:aspartate kinase|nr:aspartate kinase [Planctomycetota bacterium]